MERLVSALGFDYEARADLLLSIDVYCYACDDAKVVNNLADHLGNFGIEVAGQKKTEKTMTELVSFEPHSTRFEVSLTVLSLCSKSSRTSTLISP